MGVVCVDAGGGCGMVMAGRWDQHQPASGVWTHKNSQGLWGWSVGGLQEEDDWLMGAKKRERERALRTRNCWQLVHDGTD